MYECAIRPRDTTETKATAFTPKPAKTSRKQKPGNHKTTISIIPAVTYQLQ